MVDLIPPGFDVTAIVRSSMRRMIGWDPMVRVVFVVVAVGLVASGCGLVGSDRDAADVFAAVSPSVVLVEVGATNGSGFVVDGGYVVTNQHVVGLDPTASVLVPGAEDFVEVDVVAIDPVLDLAVLGPIDDAPPALEWGASADLDPGDPIWAVGYPGRRGLSAEPHITEGVLAQRRGMALYDQVYLEGSNAGAGGQSGGVFVDAHGDVVGVTTLQLTEARFLAALSSEDASAGVAALIESGGTDVSGVPLDQHDDLEIDPQGVRIFRFVVDEETDLDISVSSGRADLWLEVIDPAAHSVGGADDPPIDYFDPSPGPATADFENAFYVDDGTSGEEVLEASIPGPGVYYLRVGTFNQFATAGVELRSNVELTELRVHRDDERNLVVGETADGLVLGAADSEVWLVDADEGDTLRVRVDSIAVVFAVVRDADGSLVSSARFSEGESIGSALDFEVTVEKDGRYEIEVAEALGPVSLVGYRILVDSIDMSRSVEATDGVATPEAATPTAEATDAVATSEATPTAEPTDAADSSEATPTAEPTVAPSTPQPSPQPIGSTPSALGWTRTIVDQGGEPGLAQWVWDVESTFAGFVAVGHESYEPGESAAVWTSLDGTTWARAAPIGEVDDRPTTQRMSGIAASDSLIVAVGSEQRVGRTTSAVWSSTNGVDWRPVVHSRSAFESGRVSMADIAHGVEGFVAVGQDRGPSDGVVWFSADGNGWQRIPDDPEVFGRDNVAINAVIARPEGGFVAVGDNFTTGNGAVWLSPDGMTWSRVPDDSAPSSTGRAHMNAVTRSAAGHFVAVGTDSTDRTTPAVWTSPDATAWTRLPLGLLADNDESAEINDIATTRDGLVAIGQIESAAAIWTSSDSLNWTRHADDPVLFAPSELPAALAANIDTTVAVGIVESTDVDVRAWIWNQ